MASIGRYEIVRQLGEGAMGRVFLARDPSLERPVALKVLHESLVQGAARSRFRDEAKTLAALSHPGIVTIFEIGEFEGQDFIAMEYLPGETLRDLLALQAGEVRGRRGEYIAICANVATAVAAAHRAGILHRDIKPENVVVTRSGDVKVVDFGIARRLGEKEPAAAADTEAPFNIATTFVGIGVAADGATLPPGTNTIFGTPAYMAPEVLEGRASSEASDVYSLGVMLYECLAGKRPYGAGTLVELIAHVVDGSDPPPRLDDPLADLVTRMMARDPAARPTLAEVAKILTPPARAVRWPFVVAALLTVIVGAIGTVQLAGRPKPLQIETIVIEPFRVDLPPSYGLTPPWDAALADVLDVLLRDIKGVRSVVGVDPLYNELEIKRRLVGDGPSPPLPDHGVDEAERRLGARYAVRGRLTDQGQRQITIDVVDLTDQSVKTFVVVDTQHDVPKLMDDVAETVAKTIEPRAELDRQPNRGRARTLYDLAAVRYAANRFHDARPCIEQAIDADPTLFDAWYLLATLRSWLLARHDEILAAIDKARDYARSDAERRLVAGTRQYLDNDLAAARATLTPLVMSKELRASEHRDATYYLAEAHWHDGHFKQGFDLFQSVLRIDGGFLPACIHPLQYAIAHRDEETAWPLIHLQQDTHDDTLDFAMERYDKLIAAGSGLRLPAMLVLGQTPLPEDENSVANNVDRLAWRLARAMEGHESDARQIFDEILAAVAEEVKQGRITPARAHTLTMLTDTLLVAGWGEQARQVSQLVATYVPDDVNYRRQLVLAAPLVGDRGLIGREHLTDRERQIADAIEAEMTGNRERAVELLAAVVEDASSSWDFPERAALLRNLRALHRTDEARALCTKTRHPAVFRPAFLPFRHACSTNAE